MISVAVIGYGYWGPNLVRNFEDRPETRVELVCDVSPKRLASAQALHPGIKVTRDVEEVLRSSRVDAVAIATPVSSHFDLAIRAMRAGKHVLVEKPIAWQAGQAEQMIEEAERRGLVLMVDHTFVYTSAVQKIKELVDLGRLGDLYYYDSVRVNLGLFQHDVNVLWDLAVHDLSIMDYVIAERPTAVSATGVSHVRGQPENIAYLTLFFASNLIAHFHVNWMAPAKIRRTLIGGSREMVVYDDLEPSEKVKIYDKGISLTEHPEALYEVMVSYRTGDMWAPHLATTEALSIEVGEFARCISTGQTPLTDGQAGLRVVRILEAAAVSLAQKGNVISLDSQEARRPVRS